MNDYSYFLKDLVHSVVDLSTPLLGSGNNDAIAIPEMTSSTVSPPSSNMRGPQNFEKKVEEMKPSKSDINWVIMDYLVSEGYPGAAEKFAQETNICSPSDIASIRDHVRIRTAIHRGRVAEAIEMVNEIDPEFHAPLISASPEALMKQHSHFSPQYDHGMTLIAKHVFHSRAQFAEPTPNQIIDTNPVLHFRLLQLQLIEIIRTILEKPTPPQREDFIPALEFATQQLAPRAPTDPVYRTALERTMALLIFPHEKMPPEFKELLDPRLRDRVASDVTKAILVSKGERAEAKIRQLVRARAWAEAQAREAKIECPPYVSIGLDADEQVNGGPTADGDAMVS